MFSNEYRFILQSNSRRTFIRRVPDIRYNHKNINHRQRFCGAGLILWDGEIILGSRTDLHVQMTAMADEIYQDGILENHVRSFRSARGEEFCVYGCQCLSSPWKHRKRMLSIVGYHPYVLASILTRLESIRNMLDMLSQRVAALQPLPTCLTELRSALLDEGRNSER
ncbi:uncharacterized protein TNCV_2909631 [Trichonephila clavipes]|nr:uncharacterized protein TNCV_2909631 [Trichonephila clavipes]